MRQLRYPLRIRVWYVVHDAAERLWHWVYRTKLGPWHQADRVNRPQVPPTYHYIESHCHRCGQTLTAAEDAAFECRRCGKLQQVNRIYKSFGSVPTVRQAPETYRYQLSLLRPAGVTLPSADPASSDRGDAARPG